MSTSTSLADWYLPRRRMLRWVSAGLVSFAAVFVLLLSFAPRMAPIGSPVDRLALAVQLCALTSGCCRTPSSSS